MYMANSRFSGGCFDVSIEKKLLEVFHDICHIPPESYRVKPLHSLIHVQEMIHNDILCCYHTYM